VREKEQIGSQDSGYRSAGPDHRGCRLGVGKHLGQSGAKPREQVEEQKSKMPQAVFDIVSENPEIQHVADQMQKAPMEEHGRKKGQEGRKQTFPVKNLPVDDLIRDRPPLEDKLLCGWEAERQLMVKDEAIGQNQCDRYEGKRVRGIIIFERQKQRRFPCLTD